MAEAAVAEAPAAAAVAEPGMMAMEITSEAVDAPVEATPEAAETTAEPVQAETEAAAAEPVQAETPEAQAPDAEVQKWRGRAMQVKEQNDYFSGLITNDAVLRKEYLRAVQRSGRTLPAEIAAELVEEAPAASAAKPLTIEQARVKAKELRAAGRDEEAFETLVDAKMAAALSPVASKTDAIDKSITAENQRRATEQATRESQANAQHVYNEMVGLQKIYPSLVGIDKDGRVSFTDPAFHKKIVEHSSGLGHKADLRLIAKVALADLGRLGVSPKSVAGTKPPVGVASASAAPTKNNSKAPEPGEMAIEVNLA